MSDRCVTEAELAGLLEAPAGDPRRAHIDDCPRCRALLAEYHAFLSVSAGVPEADRADADARLAGFLAREVAAGGAPPVRPDAAPSLAARLARWWRTPAAAPALAFAAVAVVAGGVAVLTLTRGPIEAGAPRGTPVMRGQADAGVVLAVPETLPDGGVRLSWTAMTGADGYDVVIYSPLLDALGRERVSGATTLTLPGDRLAVLAAGDTVLVRVRALRAGAPIGESRLEPLLPR